MIEQQKIVYSEYPAFQQIFWATGYGTKEAIANAALTIWENSQQYEKSVLNPVIPYGAVAVHKSGDIYYITYIAYSFR